jgi:hypothetical protein
MLVIPNGKPSVAEFQNWAQSQYGAPASREDLDRIGREVGIADENKISQDQFDRAKGIYGQGRQVKGPQGGGQTIPTTGSGQTTTGVPPSYQMQQFSQFQPNQQWTNQRNDLMSAILKNPRTMDQTWQDQMYESQKEQAQGMAKQLGLQNQQNMVSRGFGPQGGQASAYQGKLDENLMAQLLGGRRDIATQATQQNRQDELQALSASLGLQGGDIQSYMAQLAGQQAQAGENQFGSGFGMDRAKFDWMQRDSDRGKLLQEFLAREGTGLERDRFGEGQRQFNQGHLLDILRFMEGRNQFGQTFGENQRQFNNQMGFNWAGQQSNDLNELLRLFQFLGM